MLIHAILLSLLAGLAIPAGAALARSGLLERSWDKEEVRHAIIGMGAGALVAAVALVLLPEGAHKQSDHLVIATFIAGSIIFMLIDRALSKRSGSVSQFLAMMLDFIPEAIVLGAIITQSLAQAVFLAVIIAAQNLPEGYASYLDLSDSKVSRRRLWAMFLVVGFSGPLYILLGTTVFSHMDTVLGMMMTFCAGGILYLVFNDVAPRVRMRDHWLPSLGVIAGFSIGLVGYLYTS